MRVPPRCKPGAAGGPSIPGAPRPGIITVSSLRRDTRRKQSHHVKVTNRAANYDPRPPSKPAVRRTRLFVDSPDLTDSAGVVNTI